MIHVAWQVSNTPAWIGGLNYYVNLATALFSLPNREVEPVLLGTREGLPPLFDRCRVLPCPGIATRRWNPWRILDAVQRFCFDDGGLMGAYLKRNGINLLSHGKILGRRSPVPAMCWIPDFQHVHLPQFFTPKERMWRDITFKNIAERAQAVVLSSNAARDDFMRLFPAAVAKTHVLHFVAAVSGAGLPPPAGLLEKYDIHEPYLHVPNQLWAHKNHTIIVDALDILRQQGHCPLVISTGQTNDYRNPGYFSELKEKVRAKHLEERLRFLGLIPYQDISALMRGAVALINPSLFEGWSTTVEEAKSLGKRMILSNINVHREQAPERGIFFDPNDAEALADAVATVLKEYDQDADREAMNIARAKLPARIREYGAEYQEIVKQVIY